MNNTREAFNKAATDYDVSFTNTTIGTMQRLRVWNYLENKLKNRKAEVLEINCGTGEDAIWLSNKCYSVLATDAAGSMTTVAESKRIIAGINNVTFRTIDFFNLHKSLNPQQFDFIFSDFGGLNCVNEPELEHLSKDFAKLLYPGGKLIMVVMGKYCLWETIYFLLKFKIGKALRRWDNKGVHTKIEEEEFETWFYSVRGLKKIFSAHFKLVDVKPIAVAVPPSYLQNYFNKKPNWLQRFNSWDNVLTRFKILSNLSDHLILTFELKKPVEL
jgi:ubiquinone/menaquinone biosynthesis C-methylase UbiE